MKKILLFLAVLLMTFSYSFPAFAQTKWEERNDYDKPICCVNGEVNDENIGTVINPNGIVQIWYDGDGELISWELPLLEEGKDYEIMVNESGQPFAIRLLNENHKLPYINAIVKCDETVHKQNLNIIDFFKNIHPKPYILIAGLCLAGIVSAIEKKIEKSKTV